MKTITADTFRGLQEKRKAVLCGSVPYLINPTDGKLVPVRVVPECGETVKVQAYGVGLRWYCPRCDCRSNWYGHPTISFTNGPPPQDRICHRPG